MLDRYGILQTDVGDEGMRRAFETLAKLLESRLRRAVIDAVADSGYKKGLSPSALAAQEALIVIGQRQAKAKGRTVFGRRRHRDPGMGIELDLTNDEQLGIFKTFALHSINAEAYGEDSSRVLLWAVDRGDAVIFEAEEELLAQLISRSGIAADAIAPAATGRK